TPSSGPGTACRPTRRPRRLNSPRAPRDCCSIRCTRPRRWPRCSRTYGRAASRPTRPCSSGIPAAPPPFSHEVIVPASLSFLGAARTVTGSKHLLDVDGTRVLVDAGQFQGVKELRERNWARLPVSAASLDAIVLTHAHLDHCGLLPKIVAEGFKGRVYCTAGTAALAKLVLADAGKIQEEDAERANRKGYTKHTPALPLFTVEDAWKAIDRFQVMGYGYDFEPVPGVTMSFINAGHLLGSAYVKATVKALEDRTILFGGDLGRYDRPVLPDPEPVAEADWLLVESTYGNRVHEPDDNGERLAHIISETIERGGKVVIPAFAIGRVEEVLYWIRELEDANRIPKVPVFVDSPMAVEALKMYS